MDRKIVEYLIQGLGIKKIARQLHVGNERVRRLREMAREYGYLDERGKAGPKALPCYPEAVFPDPVDKRAMRISEAHDLLDRYREWIEERLKAGWHKVTVFEELPEAVGRSSFYRYLDRHGLYRLGEKIRRRVVPEIVHQPGEVLILDWGKLRDVVDPQTGKKRPLWMFSGVLGCSRYQMVRLVWSNDVAATLAAIEDMFQEMGGVPWKITSDNPKCFAIKSSKYEPILNPVFERFAAHYGCIIECLPPASPELKGKVERQMSYLRRLYEAHGERWDGMGESQAYIDKKLEIANKRKHGTTQRRPIDLFLEVESGALKNLPPLSYEVETISETTVRKDGHIRFQNKYYSLDEKYIGRYVTVLGNSEMISIYCNGNLIETHPRITDPYQSKSTKPCHRKPWERSLEDNSLYRKRAANLGENVEKLIVAILKQGEGFIDTRKVWGILSLDKSYPKDKIDAACKMAIEMDSIGYRSVKQILNLIVPPQRKKSTAECNVLRDSKKGGNYKFLRPLSEYEKQIAMFH